jgi:hypothetical protein
LCLHITIRTIDITSVFASITTIAIIAIIATIAIVAIIAMATPQPFLAEAALVCEDEH